MQALFEGAHFLFTKMMGETPEHDTLASFDKPTPHEAKRRCAPTPRLALGSGLPPQRRSKAAAYERCDSNPWPKAQASPDHSLPTALSACHAVPHIGHGAWPQILFENVARERAPTEAARTCNAVMFSGSPLLLSKRPSTWTRCDHRGHTLPTLRSNNN